MRRRELITFLGGAAASCVSWPITVSGQPATKRIGVLTTFAESDPEGQSSVHALVRKLRELGWMDGHNLRIDYRWGAAELGRAEALAKELIALQPELIIGCAAPAAIALWKATRSVPIVFAQVVDPVELGLVSSMARPGGNITGFTHFELTMGGKWAELLKEIAPTISRGAVIYFPDNPAAAAYLHAIEAVPASVGLQLIPIGVRDAAELERNMETFAREPNSAMIVLPNPVTQEHRAATIALAARLSLPAIYPFRYYAKNGGLLSYGVDLNDVYQRAATYVDRVLRGEKPADLPVQQPTKFELVINLKTAKALGLEVPLTLQARADEVIE
jgi:putative tryptophan/tyrosine transport system substrate-binding protein